MTYTKNGITVYSTFKNIEDRLRADGWTAEEEDVPISERVEALEEAVTDIASEVYKDG